MRGQPIVILCDHVFTNLLFYLLVSYYRASIQCLVKTRLMLYLNYTTSIYHHLFDQEKKPSFSHNTRKEGILIPNVSYKNFFQIIFLFAMYILLKISPPTVSENGYEWVSLFVTSYHQTTENKTCYKYIPILE